MNEKGREEMPNCKECDWWKIADTKNNSNGSVLGRCIARSPSVTAVVMPVKNQITNEILPQILEVTSWPLPAGDSPACGDFKPKKEPLVIPDVGKRITMKPSDL